MADTYTTQGTTFARGDSASPEVFTTVPLLNGIGPIGQDRALIDVTNLSSTSREYKKAIKDGKEFTARFQYDPNDTPQSDLRTDKDGETARNYRITLSDSPATTITFAAQVIGWEIDDVPIDDVYGLTVTFKPTGDLTFA